MTSFIGACLHVANRIFAQGAVDIEPPIRRTRGPNRVWNPDDELQVTDKCDLAVVGCAEHKRRRYAGLSNCRTIADAMQLTIQPTRTSSPRSYSVSDLSYDVKTGYVVVRASHDATRASA